MNKANNDFNNFSSFVQFCKDNRFQFIPGTQDTVETRVDLFKKGGEIKIKEKNKGSFTRYCGGNVTSECIRRGKNSPNPKIRKKATFAANARKWKHQNGGVLVTYNIDKLNDLLNGLRKNV